MTGFSISIALMNRLFYILLVGFIVLIPILTVPSKSYALQEAAGNIVVNINPGETKSFQWGLVSDTNKTITVGLRAEGKGLEFLSFPSAVTLKPNQLFNVDVSVTIPAGCAGGLEFRPYLFATEAGEKTGPTIINVQVLKVPTIVVGKNTNSNLVDKDCTLDIPLKRFVEPVSMNGTSANLVIESSSEVSNVIFDGEGKRILFHVIGTNGTVGRSIVHVGNILGPPYSVLVDGRGRTDFETFTNTTSGESYIKIDYHHSEHDIIITGAMVVPEFSQYVVPIATSGSIGVLLVLGKMTFKLNSREPT